LKFIGDIHSYRYLTPPGLLKFMRDIDSYRYLTPSGVWICEIIPTPEELNIYRKSHHEMQSPNSGGVEYV
jgi:hypothetical protein